MKTRLSATVALLLTALSAPAQDRELLYSDPAIPPREALERLNLEVAWKANLPMEGRRDNVASVQHTGRQILAQTRGGVVALFDAETGRLIWRASVGDPFRVSFPPAFNSTSVFAINGTTLYALDRSSGILQWELTLPGGLASPPVADEDQVYIFTADGTVFAFRPYTLEAPADDKRETELPIYGAAAAPKKEERLVRVVRPFRVWEVSTRLRLDLPSVQSPDMLIVPSPSGVILGITKNPEIAYRAEAFRFPLDSTLAAGPGAFGTMAYFPGRDGYVYAFDTVGVRVSWRYLAGTAALTRAPAVTEQDLYVVSEGNGMSRLDRETGNPVWRIRSGDRMVNAQREADRFLAASPKFVYALDRSGRLVILDRTRGSLLSRYDVRDFVVPIVNDQTDRLYLAANNGLLLCLRDRDYPQPQRQRKIGAKEADAGKTPEERTRDLTELLKKPVSFKAAEPQPLSKFLDDIRRIHGVKSFISEQSFRDKGKPSPVDLKVRIPEKAMPLGALIQEVLGQLGATYGQLGEQIFIIPKEPGAKP